MPPKKPVTTAAPKGVVSAAKPKGVVSAAKPAEYPATLGACADLYGDIREKRLAADRVAATLAEQENAIKGHIIATLPSVEASGVAGKRWRVTRNVKTKPSVVDWAAFYKYILKVKRPELLQMRPSEGAIGEIWDAGKSVPGVEQFKVVSLTIGKAK